MPSCHFVLTVTHCAQVSYNPPHCFKSLPPLPFPPAASKTERTTLACVAAKLTSSHDKHRQLKRKERQRRERVEAVGGIKMEDWSLGASAGSLLNGGVQREEGRAVLVLPPALSMHAPVLSMCTHVLIHISLSLHAVFTFTLLPPSIHPSRPPF